MADDKGSTRKAAAAAVVGHELRDRSVIDTATEVIFVSVASPFPKTGYLNKWEWFSRRNAKLELMVVRPAPGPSFTVLSHETVESGTGIVSHVPAEGPIQVDAGDLMAWRFESCASVPFDASGEGYVGWPLYPIGTPRVGSQLPAFHCTDRRTYSIRAHWGATKPSAAAASLLRTEVVGHKQLKDRQHLDGATSITFVMVGNPILKAGTLSQWQWYSRRNARLGLLVVRPAGERFLVVSYENVMSGTGVQAHTAERQTRVKQGDMLAFRFESESSVPFDSHSGTVGWTHYPGPSTAVGGYFDLSVRSDARAYSICASINTIEDARAEKKWGDDMAALVGDSTHSDVTLVIDSDNSTIAAHKCILASRLDFFNKAFSSQWGSSTTVHLPAQFSREGVLSFLQFVYSGVLPERCSNPVEVLQIADYFCCPEASVAASRLACETQLRVPEVFHLAAVASALGSDVLESICFDFMRGNYEECVEHPEFFETDKEIVKRFLLFCKQK